VSAYFYAYNLNPSKFHFMKGGLQDMSMSHDEYIDLSVDNIDDTKDIEFDTYNDEIRINPVLKTHLDDGDKLVWYKDPTIIATWHSNGRLDVPCFDATDVTISAVNFRILKGHWRTKDEHGVGTESNHWLYDDKPISEYLDLYPDFWKANEIKEVQPKKERKPRQKKEISDKTVNVIVPEHEDINEYYMNKYRSYALLHSTYGENRSNILHTQVTPPDIAEKMVDMLPKDVWRIDSKFLDIYCKSGIFLEVIINKLIDNVDYSSVVDNDDEDAKRDYIIKNQIYALCWNDEDFWNFVQIVLFDKVKFSGHNIIPFDHSKLYIKDKDCIKKIQETFNNMKINVVIGNPPYQESTNGEGKQSKTLYDRFVTSGITISKDIVIMITNNTFLTNDAKKELRDNMISSGLNRLDNYPIGGEVFRGVGVACCIFRINKAHNEHKLSYKRIENGNIVNEYTNEISVGDIIPESKYEISIPNKCTSNRNIADILLGEKAFGLSTKGRKGFIGGEEIIESSPIEFDNAVKLLHNFDGVEDICYVNIKDIPRGTEYINYYKVICPRIITKQSVNALNKVSIIEPNVICTQHWSTIGVFRDKAQALNLVSYIKTKYFQFLAYTFSSNGVTGLNTTLLWHIPLQDFTSNSDIDWSQPVGITSTPQEIFDDIGKDLKDCKDKSIDAQLYRKYNLTPEEIAYIEKTIK